MRTRSRSGTGLVAACFALGLIQHVAVAATDAVFIMQAPANDAPSYDSGYSAEMRGQGTHDNTPEADARPGEYYFRRGAYAFQKKDYAFAVQMYEVAASWAYKPAEYNLGVMYARGQGVPVDLPRGMAWMALAAERNDAHYVDAREAVYAEMTTEQFAQANEIWRELKKTYGDDVALRRAKARWAEVRAGMTGSRVGSAVHLDVSGPGPGLANPGHPKIMVGGGPGEKGAGARPSVSSAAEINGGQGVDGSTAYRQLLESDNPYDPKFEQSALGRATVGPPQTLKPGAPNHDAADDQPDKTRHDQ